MDKIELKDFSLTSSGINIEAASGDKKEKNAKFSILAYNGGVVSVGWYGDIVIDLAGISIPKQEIPILNGHRREVEAVLGKTEKVTVEADGTILAYGILYSSTDETAKGIVAKSKDGHPWESSVGIEPTVIEEILAGESETVNGKDVAGPVYVARKSKLKEISIVVHGADSETVVDIAAKKQKNIIGDDIMAKEKVKDALIEASKEKKGTEIAKTPVEAKKVEPQIEMSAINNAHALNLTRIASIEALKVSAAIKAQGIKENWSVDKVELAGFRDGLASAPGVIVKKHENLNANILEASILLKSGYSVPKLEKRLDAKTLDMADANRSISLKSMIAICCEQEGKQAPAIHASADEWINAAFSTTSVSGILSNVANKMLEMGFETSDDAAAIMKICKERSLNDLKTNTMYRMFTGSKLPVVPGGGPLQYDTLSESSQTIQAQTHGKLIGITRAMIINDDLGAFTQIAEKMGIDAFEQFADDGVAMIEDATIFSGGNANVDTSSEVPSVAGYNAMRLLFAAFTETTSSTKLIGAKPQSVIVPAALFTQAQSMFVSQNLIATGVGSSAATVGEANPFARNYEVIEISRLASATTWYGLANPSRIPAFNVGFLNGRKAPSVEEVAVAPEYLGKAWRIVWDYGFAEGDYQGAVRMSTS